MAKITNVGGSPAAPDPNNTPAKSPPHLASAGRPNSMTEFMKLFSPEEKEKFMGILSQNCSRELDRVSKHYLEEVKRERRESEER